METLLQALPYKHWLIGVGLDSDEKDNPPVKFADVFARARREGLKLTMHCDVNQKNTLVHIGQVLHDIRVDRIDHGVNSLEDPALCAVIAERYGVVVHERTVGKMLRRMGLTRLQPRPYHPKKDAAAQEAFKKTSPPS